MGNLKQNYLKLGSKKNHLLIKISCSMHTDLNESPTAVYISYKQIMPKLCLQYS